MSKQHNTFVLSLGGSLVVPNGGIDTEYLKRFNAFIRNQISSRKRRFFIVVGGGSTMRHYRDAAKTVLDGNILNDDLDWLGIHATRLNAHLIRTIFIDIANAHIIEHYDQPFEATEDVVVASGWKPGWSTDYCAVTLCKNYGIKAMVNMTNVDLVYDKDPKKFSNAKPLVATTWKAYRAIAGNKWIPGLNLPFDPIASKLADELGVTVKIVNGKNIQNLYDALDGMEFVGTTIVK